MKVYFRTLFKLIGFFWEDDFFYAFAFPKDDFYYPRVLLARTLLFHQLFCWKKMKKITIPKERLPDLKESFVGLCNSVVRKNEEKAEKAFWNLLSSDFFRPFDLRIISHEYHKDGSLAIEYTYR